MRLTTLRLARAAARSGGLWTIVDQAISSLGTLALSVFVARNVSTTAFGAFGLAFAAYALFVGLNRALVSEPWLVRASREAANGVARRFDSAVATTAGTAISLAVISAVVGVSTTGALHTAFLSLALVLPGLLVQDLCRYFFFAARRYGGAAILDAVWTGTYLAAIVWLELRGATTLAPFVLSWGAGAYLSALIAFGWLRISPAALLGARRGLAFLRETKGHGGPLAAEYALALGSYNLALVGVAALASTASIAALRGAQVLFGPLQVLGYAGAAFLLPRWSAREASGSKAYRRLALQAALVLVALTVALAAALQAVPESLGTSLLGKSWPEVEAILLLYALFMVVNSAQIGMNYALRAAARSDRLLIATAVRAPLTLGLVVLGASLAETQGAVGGLLVSHSVSLLVTYRQIIGLTTPASEGGE